jgi:hypothetical protein
MLRTKGTKSCSEDVSGTHWKLGEHVRNWLGTLMEHSANTLGIHGEKKKSNIPNFPQTKKKLGTLSACYFTPLARRMFWFFACFDLG